MILTLAVIGLLVTTIFTVITQNEITSINEDIEEIKELTDKPLSVRILADITSGTFPLIVNFRQLTLNNKSKLDYYWDFGNGNTSDEINPTYKYTSSGVFCCKLTVEDGEKSVSDSINISVFPNEPPKIKIKASSTSDFRPAKINFDAEAFDPEGEELEYQWVLTHPPIMGFYENKDTFNTKKFSKLFIRNGNYILKLTVTDEAGNQVVDYETINIKVTRVEGLINQLKFLYTVTLPGQLDLIWGALNIFGLEKYLDNNWLGMSPFMQNIITFIIQMSRSVDYEPPIPKADLVVSDIPDINLSSYVNDTTGKVEAGASVSSLFTISNNDTSNTARSVYITLDKPLSEKEGLEDEIEVEELTVDLEAGVVSNKLFYNGKYTKWEDSYNIQKLAPGDSIDLGITVNLEEDATFSKGAYNCTLYIYQEKYLKKAEFVDEIPFTIII